MWKRDDNVRPPAPPGPTPAPATEPVARPQPFTERPQVNIGKSVVIKGELNGSEDLTIEGHVEGTIQLRDHVLTIGPNGRIKAQVFAKSVIILGEVTGRQMPEGFWPPRRCQKGIMANSTMHQMKAMVNHTFSAL